MWGARSGDALCSIPAPKARGDVGNLEFRCWFQQGFVIRSLQLEAKPPYAACSRQSDARCFSYILQRGKETGKTRGLKLQLQVKCRVDTKLARTGSRRGRTAMNLQCSESRGLPLPLLSDFHRG